ncbi:MAG: putative SAM-dependent methyltransferase [Polyangiaceae bacterium]|jgi:SAM-dependent methyltransferase|nr:putative SAM-dependent methyltransferase [Polyangiaceae bacterium]
MLQDMTDAPKPSPLAAPDPWNLVADDYTMELLPMFELFSKDALALAPTHAGAKVLDVACGPGTLTLLAAEAGRSVSSIDFSPQMVKNLKRRLNGAQQGADVREGDGQALPWGNDEFDAAFSMFGLMFFPDRAKGFSELYRVLKPGGAAVVSSWAPFEGVFVSIMQAMREVLPDIPFGSGKGPLGDPDELTEELRAAGFADVSVKTITHRLPGDTPAEFWAQTQRTTAPVVLLKNRLGEDEWKRVTQGVVGRLESQYGTAPVEIQTTAYLGFGRKS